MATLNAQLSFDVDAYAATDSETLVVDSRTREIYIPSSDNLFGVQYDKESNAIHFKVINTVTEIFKMEDAIIRINYRDSKNVLGSSLAVDVVIDDDTCEFTWIIPYTALKNKGDLYFVVSATITEGSLVSKRWASTLAKVTIPESLYVSASTVDQAQKDEVAYMLLLVAEKCGQAKSDVEDVVKAGLLTLNETIDSGNTKLKELIMDYGLRLTDLDALKARVDQLIANPEGSPTVNTELADIRVAYDGTTYASAGSAVRDQISVIMEMLLLNRFSVPLAVDDETQLVDENSYPIVADWKYKIV